MDNGNQEQQALETAANRAALDAFLDQLTPRQITQLAAVVHALGVCNAQRREVKA